MSYHILFIDDSDDFLFGVKKSLNNKYQISISNNFEHAVTIMQQDPVDLVFLDVNFGKEENGIQKIKYIKEIDSSAIIIMLSAQRDSNLIVNSMKQGASDYLCKPYPHRKLSAVIERNLAKKDVTDRNSALIEHLNINQIRFQIIGKSQAFLSVINKASKLKGHDAGVLIEGESGTGKEVLARYIHSIEKNNKRPFIAINCAAIPDALVETELFGHEKGSFTGADRRVAQD